MKFRFTTVFNISVLILAIFIIWGFFLPDTLVRITSAIQNLIQETFGWFYLLSASGFLIFCVFLIFSRYGKIRLGKDTDRPEYSLFTWFAMLFSAGMGIGLVFWGVAEPLSHYFNPILEEVGTPQAARDAMRYSFFHWGLHPWGIYTVLALALAYFKFRKNAPGLISSIFTPILKEKVNGPVGKLIDILAVFATAFGVATSLGFGASQISGGLSYISDIPSTIGTKVVIIIIITILFILSASTGLNRGIKYLSTLNIVLAITFLLFILFSGPTNFILNLFTTTIGTYIQNLPSMSLFMGPFNQTASKWIQNWTIFYWAWWIAWAPFVGSFIARVSKGRTVREFIIGVLTVPTLFGALWFSVFGGAGLYLQINNQVPLFDTMKASGAEVVLFDLLTHYPLPLFTPILAILLIATFFITSADSAAYVLSMQTSNGSLNPSKAMKFVWGIIISFTAIALLYSGGLYGLQTALIIAAFPFTFILIGVVVSLLTCFREEVSQAKPIK